MELRHRPPWSSLASITQAPSSVRCETPALGTSSIASARLRQLALRLRSYRATPQSSMPPRSYASNDLLSVTLASTSRTSARRKRAAVVFDVSMIL